MSVINILKRLLAAIYALLFGTRADYVWPLSNSTTPDEMNTSFGPRINRDKWDFHDGIDLPATIGTNVHAMRAGTVHHAGPGGTGGYTSRHVVLEVNDPSDGLMYLVYVQTTSQHCLRQWGMKPTLSRPPWGSGRIVKEQECCTLKGAKR